MREIDPIEVAARLYAIEEVLSVLVAQHFRPDEMERFAREFYQLADRLLEAPEGAVMLPSARSGKAILAANIQRATGVLYERAGHAHAKHFARKTSSEPGV